MAELTSQNIMTKCNTLKGFWSKRNEKFKDWYGQIEMIDNLAQTNMESFVGNDPRAVFNLILYMLDQSIPHRISPKELTIEEAEPAAQLSDFFSYAWRDVYNQYRRRGRYWLRDFIGFMLATGWYSVFSVISADGSRCIAEVWNPATVFPSWDDDLAECAHIFPMSGASAKRLAARNNWTIPAQLPKSQVIIYDYWWLDDDNKVWNSIVLNRNLVKPPFHESRLKRIPVFVAPVGGLPDTGDLVPPGSVDRWRGELGQSVIASNENIYNYWNKWWTFSMQLLRDTAQPRTFEKTRSGKPIVKPEDWNKRGAHFRMAPEDSIGFIQPPAIPIELRSAQLDMEAMMQRGGPSWAVFGNISQQLTAYVMSQIAASTNQVSHPFHQGVIDCLTDIDNFWLDMIKEQNYKPYGIGLPSGLSPEAKITAEYEIRIPGDLVQRATTARILNPTFELSEERVMEELFPEIKNPVEEIARVQGNKARKHPIYSQIVLIDALRTDAEELRKAGDLDAAATYDKAAATLEASLAPIEEEAAPPAGLPAGRAERTVEGGPVPTRPPGIGPETLPPPSPATQIR